MEENSSDSPQGICKHTISRWSKVGNIETTTWSRLSPLAHNCHLHRRLLLSEELLEDAPLGRGGSGLGSSRGLFTCRAATDGHTHASAHSSPAEAERLTCGRALAALGVAVLVVVGVGGFGGRLGLRGRLSLQGLRSLGHGFLLQTQVD